MNPKKPLIVLNTKQIKSFVVPKGFRKIYRTSDSFPKELLNAYHASCIGMASEKYIS